MDPHTGPRLVTLSARCTPPWHQQLINLVTWVLYLERSEGSPGRWSPTRPPAHTLPWLYILLHYTAQWTVSVAVMKIFRAKSWYKMSPYSAVLHTG